jgi:hypothetical protein
MTLGSLIFLGVQEIAKKLKNVGVVMVFAIYPISPETATPL